jgi:DNA-binding response OmpR family regulator
MLRILVVEDDAPLRETIATVLCADGFEVDTASDGRRAIEKLQDSSFDAIVVDIRMPGLDGPGLYRELAARQPALLPRIIFTTGDVLSDWVRTFLEAVGGQQLYKPFDIEDMRRAIRSVVEKGAASERRACGAP